jgi:hypothetical protein
VSAGQRAFETRNLVYFVACTVDRLVAREGGATEDSLAEGERGEVVPPLN